MSKTYVLEPRMPLMFRDGRPFGAADRAETLAFPLPSTVAGALRTAHGERLRMDYSKDAQKLLEKEVRGPILARRDLTADRWETFFPKPANALYLVDENGNKRLHRLVPQAKDQAGAEGCDLPDDHLWPVLLRGSEKGKPGGGPAFWSFERTCQWLKGGDLQGISVDALGADALPVDQRTHVAIDEESRTNRAGQLYQTSGLDFGPRRIQLVRGKHVGWEQQEYGLVANADLDCPDVYRTVGGEARLARIRRGDGVWPECPEDILSGDKWLVLVLATPAIFAEGWRPGWLDSSTLEGTPPGVTGLRLRLKAAAVDRWRPVSGWDLAARGGKGAARAVRRMVPAGAVYWFEIVESSSPPPEIAKALWLKPVSDHEQDRRDGFGLVLVGSWID